MVHVQICANPDPRLHTDRRSSCFLFGARRLLVLRPPAKKGTKHAHSKFESLGATRPPARSDPALAAKRSPDTFQLVSLVEFAAVRPRLRLDRDG